MKRNLIILSCLMLGLALYAQPTYYPGSSYVINCDSSRPVRYIEVDWADSGANSQGRLYLNGVDNGVRDVGSGSYYGALFLPDQKRWANLNQYASSAYIEIENANCTIYTVRIVYLDWIDLYSSPWYYNGYYIMVSVDSSRVVRYIEVDWRNNGNYTTGTLYCTVQNADGSTGTYNYGAYSVGSGSYIFGNLYLPDTDKFNQIDRFVYNAYIYVTGSNGGAQVFQIRVVYNDSGSFYPYPGVTDPGGSVSWSWNSNNYNPGPSTTSWTYPSYPTVTQQLQPVPMYPYYPTYTQQPPIPSGNGPNHTPR